MKSTARRGTRVALAAAVALSASLLGVVALNQADAAVPAAGGPNIALMDQTGNHAMGASIRRHDPGAQTQQQAPRLQASVEGIDVSSYQGNVDWNYWWGQGKRFAYIKATEGTGYINSYFSQQYIGSYNVGMIRGAYHYARPDLSGGAAQADYFVAHGGGWSADGKTLPGTLDIEWGPNSACYGLSTGAMVQWILSFSNEYHAKTNRWPVIYTATSWWSQCTGNGGDFTSTNPLWVARYASTPGTLPYAWTFYTFWQYSSAGNMDKDTFSAGMDRLQVLATTP